MSLAEQQCVPCRGGVPPLTLDEAGGLMGKVEGWTLIDDGTKLSRTFKFGNFVEA